MFKKCYYIYKCTQIFELYIIINRLKMSSMKFKEFITFFETKNLKETSKFYLDILRLSLYKDQDVYLIFNINNQSKIAFC